MIPASERISQHRRGDYAAGREALAAELGNARRDALTIQRRMSGSEWADRHGYLPAGTGAETGRIKLYGYQRGLLDAMCDPKIPLVTVLKAARVGYTRLATLATGYHLEHEGTLCAIAQPTISDAEDFGRSEIAPMLRDTPALSRLVRPMRQGEARDTLTDIQLSSGAVLRLRGAASDDAFRRYSARFQFADELDAEGWTPGSKSQGDKLRLFWTRGETFWNRKQIRGGTPLLEETSRTWRLWQQSDQRRYFVPCPRCSEPQYLEWGGADVPYGLKWDLDTAGGLKEVYYVCRHCGQLFDEGHKHWMDARGEWRPTAKPRQPGHAGFHLWTGMSLHPNASWPIIVQEWLDAQLDPATLVQPFVNLRLGRPYKLVYGQELKTEQFLSRSEVYEAEVPRGVLFLTAGADVQSGEGKDPRIEVSVWGWGRGLECWLIGHFVLRGDPAQQAVWDDLDALLRRPFVGHDGRKHYAQAAAVDSGGHHTAETYAFCELRRERRVWAIKGRSERNGKRSKIWPKKPTVKGGGELYLIGGNAARDFVYGSLAVSEKGPRHCHFPATAPIGAEPVDESYFTQLTRERLVVRKGGFTEWVKPAAAHEAGVCFVYGYCAVAGLQSMHSGWLRAVVTQKQIPQPSAEAAEEATNGDAEQPKPTQTEQPALAPKRPLKTRRRVARSKWMGR